MKRYFAWVFFVLGAVNIVGKGTTYGSGKLLFDWPAGTINTLTFVGFVSLCLYLWNKWK
ncbi:MAG: hypothetical protein G01um101444_193 [Parcubacteria group bacterium Gr01-1014_44]|nr:MAG: hypothetical protein G01um101444_193 [Parcubacteria group bacterium Gr01-1014_44]